MLYIRTDMNGIIATGHLMRCLAIADAAKILGEDTLFILADEQAVELLKAKGYQYHVLHTKWDNMDSEVPALKSIIQEKEIRRLLVDSYMVTKNYLTRLRECVETYYIDDLNAFHYPVDALICYANYWEKYHHRENYNNTKLYLSPRYAPLKLVFAACGKKVIRKQTEKLLVLSGGTDPFDFLDCILSGIETDMYRQIDVICGTYYKKYEALCEKYKAEKTIIIHKAVTDMERYMKETDVAVSAGGTTLYELCACGVPTISYSMADNQLENVRGFEKAGIIDYAGDLRRDDVTGRIISYLRNYQFDQGLRQKKSLDMQQVVDGKGALRIAGELMG